jgi:hypothetical protein
VAFFIWTGRITAGLSSSQSQAKHGSCGFVFKGHFRSEEINVKGGPKSKRFMTHRKKERQVFLSTRHKTCPGA